MEFESPDVMKDFPGLYASGMHKTSNTDTDYSDDADKTNKKDLLKRKEKKDKKDKEKGYAALEGESSAEENCDSRSPSKSKKSKSFKFPTKSKEKREKSRDKEKDVDKKKEKDKKEKDKKVEKEKVKSEKKDKKLKYGESSDIAEALPIFGVSLALAIERSRCHDGIDLPLPLRACLDYVQRLGLCFENVYKINTPKSKVVHLKKEYNHRRNVDLTEYDVSTVTSLLKMFLRELAEPVFTADLLIRFEEAGAILNVMLREKHLKILIGNLPSCNRLVLSWIIVHLYNVTLSEKYNKMNAQHIAVAMSTSLQASQRLITALLCHCPALFPDLILEPYVPPLAHPCQLPSDLEAMEMELLKQESLLVQIHAEMNQGFISKEREELLWEVQRIITQLKRKIKIIHKDREIPEEKQDNGSTAAQDPDATSGSPVTSVESEQCQATLVNNEEEVEQVQNGVATEETCESEQPEEEPDQTLCILQLRNRLLDNLRESLMKQIEVERQEIVSLEQQVEDVCPKILPTHADTNSTSLNEVMDLLHKENQILQIKKINLVREIMENHEECIDLRARLDI